MRRGSAAAPAADHALHVVVGDRPARPAQRRTVDQVFDGAADVGRRVVIAQQLEAVRHVQPPRLRVFGHGRGGVVGGDFAERHHVGKLV